jgi:hypothetical protein
MLLQHCIFEASKITSSSTCAQLIPPYARIKLPVVKNQELGSFIQHKAKKMKYINYDDCNIKKRSSEDFLVVRVN